MQALEVHTGVVLPLNRANVDTDAILPKQFLKSIRRTGFGPHLFDGWRYLEAYDEAGDNPGRRPDPAFVLNDPAYAGASILLARENFGCGSSREHAPWALAGYGIRVLIAPSYGDIFHSNCFKNGLLALRLPKPDIDALFDLVLGSPGISLTVDLPAQRVRRADGRSHAFEVDAFHKHCLLGGLDEIGLTLQDAELIRAFEARRRIERPWLFGA
jgi:3-isopropylmalate/(R)-2-methylmalate dehydratase small subunit